MAKHKHKIYKQQATLPLPLSNKPCGWCKDSYYEDSGDVFPCICDTDCGHEACVKGPLDTLNGGELVVSEIIASQSYPTNDGKECVWCHTNKATSKGKNSCTCEKDCKTPHCLLGPHKGAYVGKSWTSSQGNGYKGGSTSTSNGSSTSAWSGSYGGTTYSVPSCSKDSHPDVLFEWEGVSFSGQKKFDLEKLVGKPGQPKRLLLNASNTLFKQEGSSSVFTPPAKIIDSCPEGALKALEDPSLILQHSITPPPVPFYADVIDLNWSDGQFFRGSVKWWMKLLELIKSEDYKEVEICCVGGHGRTGTALAAILILTHKWDKNPSVEAEEWIKTNYCKRAIETKAQQEYLDYIMIEAEKE